MEFAKFFLLFLSIWWVAIFAVLPFRVTACGNNDQGIVPSAPENPMILWKFFATTIISLILTFVAIYFFDESIAKFTNKITSIS